MHHTGLDQSRMQLDADRQKKREPSHGPLETMPWCAQNCFPLFSCPVFTSLFKPQVHTRAISRWRSGLRTTPHRASQCIMRSPGSRRALTVVHTWITEAYTIMKTVLLCTGNADPQFLIVKRVLPLRQHDLVQAILATILTA